MPQDMKIWRVKARARLIESLGGVCVDCGKSSEEVKLTFDHIMPLTDEQSSHRDRIGMHSRLVLYRKEAAEGLLELRCQRCQVLKAREPKQGTLPLKMDNANIPF